jgi:predicted DsbA family dithiol-disulfide isomerase
MIEGAGLTFDPSPTMPNTLHALQVTELARDAGLHEPVHTRLMHAYWSEGKSLGDDETLLELVAEVGLDRDEAQATIAESRYSDRIAASTQEANRLGIYAIPAFILGRKLVVMGAQPEELFEQAVEQLNGEPAG